MCLCTCFKDKPLAGVDKKRVVPLKSLSLIAEKRMGFSPDSQISMPAPNKVKARIEQNCGVRSLSPVIAITGTLPTFGVHVIGDRKDTSLFT